jgi:hypothetical protein
MLFQIHNLYCYAEAAEARKRCEQVEEDWRIMADRLAVARMVGGAVQLLNPVRLLDSVYP